MIERRQTSIHLVLYVDLHSDRPHRLTYQSYCKQKMKNEDTYLEGSHISSLVEDECTNKNKNKRPDMTDQYGCDINGYIYKYTYILF